MSNIEKSRTYMITRVLAAIAVTELVDDVVTECVRLRARGHATRAELNVLRVMVEEAERKRAAFDLEVPGFEGMQASYLAVCDEGGKLDA